MRIRRIVALAGVVGVSVAGLSSAHGAATCEPTIKQTAKGMYTKDCGPAKAQAQVRGKTYRFTSGTCEAGIDRKIRFFEVAIGWVQDSWTGPPIDAHAVSIHIRRYTGPGTYSTRDRAEISVSVGKSLWITAPAVPADKKLGLYRGPGTVTVSSGGLGGTFGAPVPDDIGDASTPAAALPTVRVSGSFTCR